MDPGADTAGRRRTLRAHDAGRLLRDARSPAEDTADRRARSGSCRLTVPHPAYHLPAGGGGTTAVPPTTFSLAALCVTGAPTSRSRPESVTRATEDPS